MEDSQAFATARDNGIRPGLRYRSHSRPAPHPIPMSVPEINLRYRLRVTIIQRSLEGRVLSLK